MNNLSTLQNDEACPETEALLHDYFQAELPHPWPTFKTPKPARRKQPASFWSRYSGRLALAACVALMVAGYLTLGGFFPGSQAPTDVQQKGFIGLREKGPNTDITPRPQNNQTEDPVPMPTPMGNETTRNNTK